MSKRGRRPRSETATTMQTLAEDLAAATRESRPDLRTLGESAGIQTVAAQMMRSVAEGPSVRAMAAEAMSTAGPLVRAMAAEAMSTAPRGLRELNPAVERQVDELVSLTGAVRAAEEKQARVVQSLRGAGVSWASIGWATGLTGEGARKRWGVS